MSKSFVLAVGIDEYQNADIGDLSWAAADAQAFHSAFVRGREVGSVDGRLLLNEAATAVALREALGEWLTTAGPDDNVTAFFAGHGGREIQIGGNLRSDSASYLLPTDTDINHIYSTAVSLTHELPVILGRIRAKHVTIILDCCLAGASRTFADGMRGRGIDGPNFKRMSRLSDIPVNAAVTVDKGEMHDIGEGVSVLMACGPHQGAGESDVLGHGIFTHFLLQSIEGYRSQNHRSVSLGEIYSSVVRSVVTETDASQVPMLEGRLSDQRFFLG